MIWVLQKTINQTFHIPIAIQDLDQSANSKTLIKQLKQEPILEVSTLPLDDDYIEEAVTKKEAVISLQIPKNYSSQLEQNDLHEAILLYGRDDFIGNISLEIVSQSLYNQQIPYLVHTHV
ncbi:ABC transporter, partial [Staphylococcus cohnii]